MNVPKPIAFVVSSRMATLVELDTVLGSQDLYDLLEIITIDRHNEAVLNAQD